MLCSARELALAEDHEGILDLERCVSDAARAHARDVRSTTCSARPDQVLEVEVPFNRPDGLGVVGLAREARAALRRPLDRRRAQRLPARAGVGVGLRPRARGRRGMPALHRPGHRRRADRAVTALARCAGSRRWASAPVNNVVDVTNLVLLRARPAAARLRSREALEGPAIRVRRHGPGERITTLDGKAATLDPEVLVIADRRAAGGARRRDGRRRQRGDSADTTAILLECAWFDPRAGAPRIAAARTIDRGLQALRARRGPGRLHRPRRPPSCRCCARCRPESGLGRARERQPPSPAARTLRLQDRAHRAAARCERDRGGGGALSDRARVRCRPR